MKLSIKILKYFLISFFVLSVSSSQSYTQKDVLEIIKERDLIKWASNVEKSGKLEARITEYKAKLSALEAQRVTVSRKKLN